jgi:hypothetical protein
MKEFNLEEALAGKSVQTKSGKEVTQFRYFECISAYRIIAVIEDELMSFTIDGKYRSEENESSFDLVMAPEVIKGWVNLYVHEGNRLVTSSVYKSIDIAKQNTNCNSEYPYIKTIEITNEP